MTLKPYRSVLCIPAFLSAFVMLFALVVTMGVAMAQDASMPAVPVGETAAEQLAPAIEGDGSSAESVTGIMAPASGLALELAHEEEGIAEAESGLPQLRYGTYPSQIFWLFVTFAVMYAAFSAKILPDISEVLERRREAITSDLETADNLRTEAEAVKSEYEKAIEDARLQAASLMNDLKAKMRKDADADYAAFKARSMDDIRKIEEKAEETKMRLLSEIKSVSAEVTADIVKTVTGMDASPKDAEGAIENLVGKKKAKAA